MVDTFLHICIHENICVLCLFKVNFLLIKPRYPEIGKFKNNIRIKNRATGQQLHWVNLCKHVLKGLIFVVKSMVRIANECSSIYRNYCLSV